MVLNYIYLILNQQIINQQMIILFLFELNTWDKSSKLNPLKFSCYYGVDKVNDIYTL